ncbi:hypothetical protein Taro_029482 [Colocasia esculenta]|uniref:Uncharacterized protein n=1 Tax=Colocasia esculenta TaxID=4460 RepID=A0A843VP62_COLES|nr:hypothetical protein [Colocasia esculenta]
MVYLGSKLIRFYLRDCLPLTLWILGFGDVEKDEIPLFLALSSLLFMSNSSFSSCSKLPRGAWEGGRGCPQVALEVDITKFKTWTKRKDKIGRRTSAKLTQSDDQL